MPERQTPILLIDSLLDRTCHYAFASSARLSSCALIIMPYDGLNMGQFLTELVALADNEPSRLARLNIYFDDPPPTKPAAKCMNVVAALEQLVVDLYLSQLSDTTFTHIVYHSVVVRTFLYSLSCGAFMRF